MSAENIIKRIKQDAEQQIKQIKKETNQQKQQSINQEKKQAEQQALTLLSQGKQQAENHKKILLSQASQEIKKEHMTTREHLIETCFTKAQQQLEELKGSQYQTLLKQLLEQGSQKIHKKIRVLVTRKTDEAFVKQQGYKVMGMAKGSGGIILQSEDGTITVNNTFEGIVKRKKNEIRIKVGKLLFSNQG